MAVKKVYEWFVEQEVRVFDTPRHVSARKSALPGKTITVNPASGRVEPQPELQEIKALWVVSAG
jgi:hypothetical protein